MGNLDYLLRRAGSAVVVLFGVSTIIFIVVRIIPGSPARLILGPDATPDEVAALAEKMGLTAPLPVQYFDFMLGLLRLDFGTSFTYGGSAWGEVLRRLPATATLAVAALILTVVFGLTLGVIAARYSGKLLDRFIANVSLWGQSLPTFLVGIVLILIFSWNFGILPSAGDGDLRHLILPAITLALPSLSLIIRLTRTGMLEVMNQDYIRTAKSKGLSELTIVVRHGMRNMLIPVVTVVGLEIGSFLAGSVIVETVFGWPGIGRLLADALFARDYPIAQAAVFLIAAVYIVANFLVDISYSYLDPRVNLGRKR